MVAFRFDLAGVADDVEWGLGGSRLKQTAGTDFEFRNFLDTAYVNVSGLDPTTDTHFTTKSYVDALVNGLSWKEAVRAGTVVAGTLATDFENGDVIDGVTLVTGDRILIKNQATGAENGIYIVAATGAPARAADLPTGADASGVAMFIEEGTVNADTGQVCTNDTGSAVVGTDALVFVQFSSVVAGVTSLAIAGGAVGATPIASGGPTGAITLNGFTGEAGVLSAAVVGSDVNYTVDALGIGTAKIAAAAVTEAKLAAGVMLVRRAAFVFGDFPGTVALEAVAPAGEAMEARVAVDTAFNGTTPTGEIGHPGDTSQLMTTTQIDLTRVGIYSVDIDETLSVAAQYNITLAAAVAPTAGAGVAMFSFRLG